MLLVLVLVGRLEVLLVWLVTVLGLLYHLAHSLVVIGLSVLLGQRLGEGVLVYAVDLGRLHLLPWELSRCHWLVLLLLLWSLRVLHLLLVRRDLGWLQVGPHVTVQLCSRLGHGTVLLLLSLHLGCLVLKFHYLQNQL